MPKKTKIETYSYNLTDLMEVLANDVGLAHTGRSTRNMSISAEIDPGMSYGSGGDVEPRLKSVTLHVETR